MLILKNIATKNIALQNSDIVKNNGNIRRTMTYGAFFCRWTARTFEKNN